MAVQTKEHVFTLLQDHAHQIRQFGVKRLGLFGSFVRQQHDAESDIDVLVEFAPNQKSFDTFMQLASFLEALFERRVELVTTESLSPYIGPHILKEAEYVDFSTALPATHPGGASSP
jgi:predicted nucleotidyltransferase